MLDLIFNKGTTDFYREVLVDLTSKLEKIDEVMLKAMAKYLKLEDEECFVKQYGENPTALSRFNYYPPCRRPDAVLAAKAHADASAMTYLLQDRIVEGLQTFKDGQWYKVPILPNAVVVNVGDQIEVSQTISISITIIKLLLL